MPDGNVYYARHDGIVVLKFAGNIRYTMGSVARLGELLDRLFADAEVSDFLVDLSEAENIDSTNLGLLAKIARFMMEHHGRKATLLSSNPDICSVLEAVGFDQVFTILHDAAAPDPALAPVAGEAGEDADLSRVMLEAHRELAALNEKNRATFKSVIELLEAEVKKPE